jgi:hypothetical protein
MYNVAFVYTRAAGGYEGVVTWTAFKNKSEFDAWYTAERKARQRVLEEGIMPARCVELVRQTPEACRIAAALEKSTGPTGQLNPQMFRMELALALTAIRMDETACAASDLEISPAS